MKLFQALNLSALALVLALPAARAEDSSRQAPRLGEHPAVVVARKGLQPDPNSRFYLHPARLSWSLERPLSDGEHPAVLVAHRQPSSKIDPNQFILGHPAGGGPTRSVE
ncbi:MAG TPA: hypothetical protein VH183_15960 [Burkholderiaceae bacterium]|jgi:hypothetical protein|nr:hypothetical protein [Burkholderiaceae bacterium]